MWVGEYGRAWTFTPITMRPHLNDTPWLVCTACGTPEAGCPPHCLRCSGSLAPITGATLCACGGVAYSWAGPFYTCSLCGRPAGALDVDGRRAARAARRARSRWARPGFGLLELLLSVVLLGLLGLGVARVLSQTNTRTIEGRERLTALTLAKSQIERIRAAGPLTYSTPGETYTADASGRRGAGPYRVEVRRSVRCDAGIRTEDSPPPAVGLACGDSLPSVSYVVAVSYPSQSGALVRQAIAFAGPDLRGRACTGGQVWNADASGGAGSCVCPSGQSLVAGVCQCPAGQAWDGLRCRVTTCAAPLPGGYSDYQTRSDCPANQVGSSQWRRDMPGDYCRTGSTWGAWSEVSRSCACPANLPTWDGSSCTCPAAGQPLTRPAACSGGQIQTSPDTRTFTAATCSHSAWVPGVCACPSPKVWNGSACVCSGAPTSAADTVRAATCPAPQVSTSNEIRSYDWTACTYSAWSGGSCACANPPSVAADTVRTYAGPCSGGQVPSGSEWRTYDRATCSYSAWSGGSCYCPSSAPVWTGSTCVARVCYDGDSQSEAGACTGGRTGTAWRWRTCSANAWGGWSPWDYSGCSCPSGTTWDGAACAPPAVCTEGQTQSEVGACTGGRTGQASRWRVCSANAWGGWSPWDYSGCSCPSGTTWDGSACVSVECTSGATQSEVGACSGGRTGSGTRSRTCSTGSTWGTWTPWDWSACACPSGTTWDGWTCATDDPPQVSLSVSSASAQRGQSVAFTGIERAGSAPIKSREVLASNGARSATLYLSTAFTAAGTQSAVASVWDAKDRAATASASLSVAPFAVYASASATEVEMGDPVTVSASVYSGVAPVTYDWRGLGGSGCIYISGQGTSTLTLTIANYYCQLTLVVTDGTGLQGSQSIRINRKAPTP